MRACAPVNDQAGPREIAPLNPPSHNRQKDVLVFRRSSLHSTRQHTTPLNFFLSTLIENQRKDWVDFCLHETQYNEKKILDKGSEGTLCYPT